MAEKLTAKQQSFVSAYLANGFNATRAAIEAGYSEKTAYSIGWENLRKPEIKSAIDEALAMYAMPKNEVLARLADHARGTMADFLNDGRETLDLAKADRASRLHLVKKFTHNIGKETENISIELYDAQSALVQLAKVHGLLIDKTALTTPDGKEPFSLEIKSIEYREAIPSPIEE